MRARVHHAVHELDEVILAPTQQHDNTIHFWACLSEEQKFAMCRVTEDLPLAIRDMAGLMNPFKSLLHGGVKVRILSCIVLLCRMVLNVFTVLMPAVHLFRNDSVFAHTPKRNTTLLNHNLTVCRELDIEVPGHDGMHAIIHCDSFNIDPFYTRKTTFIFEAVIVVGATVLSVAFTVMFLLNSDVEGTTEDGQMKRSDRANFIIHRPFVLVFLPRVAVNFSSLQPIALVNTGVARKWLVRGDLALYIGCLLKSIFPHRKWIGDHLFISWSEKPWPQMRRYVLEAIAVMFLTLLGLQALLHKLIVLYVTISMVRWTSWHYHSALYFFGFVNQVIGIFEYDVVELNRALLLRFGGKDGIWTPSKMRAVHHFLGLVFARLVEGRIRKQCCSGLMGLAAMVNFTSDTLQHMWLSRQRQCALEAVRDDRLEIFEVVLNRSLYGKSREERQAWMCEHMMKLKLERDEFWRSFHIAGKEEQEAIRGDILRNAERLRLLAQFQSHIADLHDHKNEESDEEDQERTENTLAEELLSSGDEDEESAME